MKQTISKLQIIIFYNINIILSNKNEPLGAQEIYQATEFR